MRYTYAHIEVLSAAAGRTDRAMQMPFLGLLSGLTLALCLWTAIAWLVWAFLG